MTRRAARAGVTVLGLCCAWAGAASAQPMVEDLRDLSIEQLANLQVTSVSGRPEDIGEAPASIDLITADDIRRSGAQNLPEVLRLARNLEVAQIDAQRHTISARGFNSFQASNKLLVLIDGRSVYTPLYSGVFWDQQHVSLSDVERIEVVSGPGGTLWGANAVNGVINIVTKTAGETQGILGQAWGGTLDQRLELRYGAALSDNLHLRVFANGFERGPSLTTTGADANDDWSGAQTGFRADWDGARNALMVQAALYEDDLSAGGSHDGGHLLGRWSHTFSDTASAEVQAYHSIAEREADGVFDSLEMTDISVQFNNALGQAHQLVWGGGLRHADSEFISPNIFELEQEKRRLRTANLFVQDEIALTQRLDLTVGLKVEDHTFTDIEYMPNVRLAWRPNDDTMVWTAVSRAVRTPSRIDRELMAPGIIIPGGFVSEDLIAYEIGYRSQPTSNSSLTATLYYHDYDKLRTSTLSPGFALPARVGNDLDGEVYGLELWGDLALANNWRISAGATLLESEFRVAPLAIDSNGSGDDPGYQVFFRSQADLTDDVSFDVDVRAIDEVAPEVPSYVELGARFAWRVTDTVEIALVGDNLLDESHIESIDGLPRESRRSLTLSTRLTY